ncbi:hypothetical protein MMC07_006580, partial [Pseudocyphellaria aurata]|nr:hypothetical protein [Pseudocyphellaria aurata]
DPLPRFHVEEYERDGGKLEVGKVLGTWMRGEEAGDILVAEESVERDTRMLSQIDSPQQERKMAVEIGDGVEGMDVEGDEHYEEH